MLFLPCWQDFLAEVHNVERNCSTFVVQLDILADTQELRADTRVRRKGEHGKGGSVEMFTRS